MREETIFEKKDCRFANIQLWRITQVNEQPPLKAGDADIPKEKQEWKFLEGLFNHHLSKP